MGKKIVINQDLCIGCGSCEALSPEHFELKGGKSHVKNQYTTEDDKVIKEAIDNCPVEAIKLENGEEPAKKIK